MSSSVLPSAEAALFAADVDALVRRVDEIACTTDLVTLLFHAANRLFTRLRRLASAEPTDDLYVNLDNSTHRLLSKLLLDAPWSRTLAAPQRLVKFSLPPQTDEAFSKIVDVLDRIGDNERFEIRHKFVSVFLVALRTSRA